MYKKWLRWLLKFISKESLPPWLAGTFTFFVYLKTMLPGLGFWDTGEFQTISRTFDIAHPTGYPSYILVSKVFLTLFSNEKTAWAMNFLSVLFVSTGIYFVSKILLETTKSKIVSTLIPIVLSTNTYLWGIATRADPHAFHFLLVNIILYLVCLFEKNKTGRYLTWIGLTLGFSMGNHMLSVFMVPLFLVLMMVNKKHIDRSLFLTTIGAFMLGISVYLLLPIISLVKPPLTIDYQINTLENFRRHVFGEDFQNQMSFWTKGSLSESLDYYLNLVKTSFPNYIWILSIPAILIGVQKRHKLLLFSMIPFFLTVYFSLKYQNAVLERYFIQSFTIISIWIGYYLGLVLNKKNLIFNFILVIYLVFNIYSNLVYGLQKNDSSSDTYASVWATDVLSTVDQNSIIFSWWSYSTPLWYMTRVENLNRDVTIINTGSEKWEDKGKSFLPNKRVFFVDQIEVNDGDYYLVKIGNIYEFKSKEINF